MRNHLLPGLSCDEQVFRLRVFWPFGVPAIAFSRRVARACRRRGIGFEGERMPHRLLRFLVEQGSHTPIPLSRASSATATGAVPRATHQCQCRHCSIIAERPAKHFSDRAVWCRAGAIAPSAGKISPLFWRQMSAVGYQTSRFASKCVIWGVRARVLSIVHRSFIMIVQYAILPKEYRREVLR